MGLNCGIFDRRWTQIHADKRKTWIVGFLGFDLPVLSVLVVKSVV
jgi:hypothetical protein